MVVAASSTVYYYLELNQLDQAREAILTAQASLYDGCYPPDRFCYLHASGQLELELGNLDAALFFNDQAVELAEYHSMAANICFAFAQRGTILSAMGRYEPAIQACVKSQQVAEQTGFQKTDGYLHNLAVLVQALHDGGREADAAFVAQDAKQCLAFVRKAGYQRRAVSKAVEILDAVSMAAG